MWKREGWVFLGILLGFLIALPFNHLAVRTAYMAGYKKASDKWDETLKGEKHAAPE